MVKSNETITDKTALAINPEANIAVFASAGSGKTHLLVHRILKLLLSGVDPSHILAITFTRKAAAEMQERLMKVLAEWATADDTQVKTTLQSLSHPHDDASIAKARKLYEELLFSEYEIRITTFHAFCQDILKRFAIHAGVPAGFRVAETNDELKQEARKRLFKAANHENKQLSNTLFTLLQHCSTVNNVNEVLDTFIDSRSDWLSFTENQSDPVGYAELCLYKLIFPKQTEKNQNSSDLIPTLQEYFSYISAHKTKTYQSYCELLSAFLGHSQPEKEQLDIIVPVFFTSKMEKREIKANKSLEKSLGTDKTQNFISLHDALCEQITNYLDIIKKEKLLEFNQAWFYAGHHLLDEYQKLKFSQHTLDFDDLEWYTYLLLNQHESAAWIQYKLDQRIQHILIDEFQDTNPTQWNLIFPLLSELAIDSHENHRSLFFVGDAKQSIYGFRRANSDLQFSAAEWAKENLNAQLIETDDSYRSSPAIINFVNIIFSQQDISSNNFNPHQAVQSELWGQVQVNQLSQAEDLEIDSPKQQGFRDPLREGKENFESDSHYLEGQQIANKICELISKTTAIMESQTPRAIKYSDIIILARNRTHLANIELALSEKRIPYSSTYDGEFLSRLEVQDILSLLTYLTQSHNDLALAQVLRSPLYGMNDQDLMEISCQPESSWHGKLKSYAQTSNNTLAKQAFEQLQNWRSIANTLPVHDLLDRIYFETNLLSRYTNSLPRDNAGGINSQVLDNLTALLQLSLDIDAGRYSSIQSFLSSLQNKQINNTSISTKTTDNTVKIMTIHSAKGLEAPVVFLVDTGPKRAQLNTYKPIINWPSDARRPDQFFLIGRKNSVDKITQSIIDQQVKTNWKEELNLLYVALTRAKQYLYITGTASIQTATKSWHSIISDSLNEDFKDLSSETWLAEYGSPPLIKAQKSEQVVKNTSMNFDLSKPFPPQEADNGDTQLADPENIEHADYGILVHKVFELIEQKHSQNDETLKLAVESSLGLKIKAQEFKNAVNEVTKCLRSTELQHVFNTTGNQEVLKEVPISFIKKGKVLYRIIDHLIINEKQAWIIDYKTTREVSTDSMQDTAKQYQHQIDTYMHAVKKLYPEKTIRASILFTAIPALYDFNYKH